MPWYWAWLVGKVSVGERKSLGLQGVDAPGRLEAPTLRRVLRMCLCMSKSMAPEGWRVIVVPVNWVDASFHVRGP